jgi:hypothetical protein
MTTTTAADLNSLKSSGWLSKTISAAWTYYLWCRDAAWNWDYKSVILHSYKVHNMLEKIAWNSGTYTTANYDVASSGTYIATSGTTLTWANIYSAPAW